MPAYISLGSKQHLNELRRLSQSGRRTRWTVNSHAVRGDVVYFYLKRPVSAIVAMGRVESAVARKGFLHNYPQFYGSMVTVDRFFDPPLLLADAQLRIPHWEWLSNPQTHAEVPPVYERELQAALQVDERVNRQEATYADPVVLPRGAGFGSPEQNRKVEAAAIKTIKARMRGWAIRDRQKHGCGYDLECRRGREEEHAEVKGIQGSIVSFPITKKEYDLAGADPNFVLYAVTAALTKTPVVHRFTGKQLRDRFTFREIAYFAKPKRGNHLLAEE